ncbi:hypothetical protein [Cupriavidus basilensis]|uniref:hypothetical protein n=1 Tax=Cupriavidus basilensis TaxID=68895 RepID=UPI00157ACFC3|nr:hypothetical protein [Cupriavidus basilensis]NUA30269.1 hypothetical protein [Cupriavidus basilensis]
MVSLRVANFLEHCVRCSRIDLPDEDHLFAATGAAYDHGRFAPKPGSAHHGWTRNLHGGQEFVFHTAALREVDFVLKAWCPWARDRRCYVPVYFTERARAAGRPHVVLQRVLTVELKCRPGTYHLHALSTRALGESTLAKLHRLGITTEVITPRSFAAVEYTNAKWCYVRLMQYGNVYDKAAEAALLAGKLHASAAQGTLGRRLRLACHVLGIPEGPSAIRLACAAAVLGYLRVEPSRPFSELDELCLLPNHRRS